MKKVGYLFAKAAAEQRAPGMILIWQLLLCFCKQHLPALLHICLHANIHTFASNPHLTVELKRHFSAILLLCCFIAPVAISFIFLQLQYNKVRREVKWQMIAGMDKSELYLIELTEMEKSAQLKWEHPGEFEYKGEMFDIVEQETNGDTTKYWCWRDYKETRLNKQLDDLVTYALGKHPKNRDNQKNLETFYKSLWFEQASETELAFHLLQKHLTISRDFSLVSCSYCPDIPPPEVA